MPSVRGIAVLNAVLFVKERYGAERHESLLAALPLERRASLLVPVREAGWVPVEDFVAYLEAAQALLAPADDGFFRELGRFAGRLEREASAFGVMVEAPVTAMRMGPVVWRSFHDAGRLEVEVLGPQEAVARIYDFPASRAMCERRCGAWEGLLSSPELRARAWETRCLRQAGPCCETRVVWEIEA